MTKTLKITHPMVLKDNQFCQGGDAWPLGNLPHGEQTGPFNGISFHVAMTFSPLQHSRAHRFVITLRSHPTCPPLQLQHGNSRVQLPSTCATRKSSPRWQCLPPSTTVSMITLLSWISDLHSIMIPKICKNHFMLASLKSLSTFFVLTVLQLLARNQRGSLLSI